MLSSLSSKAIHILCGEGFPSSYYGDTSSSSEGTSAFPSLAQVHPNHEEPKDGDVVEWYSTYALTRSGILRLTSTKQKEKMAFPSKICHPQTAYQVCFSCLGCI